MEPRKSPIQARSAQSVEAILDATVQVLLAIGKERLTTTRVAQRAGVSVGTLYQYFPNKSALVQAALSRHLERIYGAVAASCGAAHGQSQAEMAAALVNGFFEAKTRELRSSIALYQVVSDVDGLRIARETGERATGAVAAMLATAGVRVPDVELAAGVVMGAMAGIMRRVLEAPAPERHLAATRGEMLMLVTAYLEAIAACEKR